MELRTRLLVLFTVVAVTPLTVLGVFSYTQSAAVILQQVSQVVSENLIQVNHSLDYFVNDIEQLSMYIYSNETIQEILSKDPQRSLVERHTDRKTLDNLLQSFLGFKSWDIDIYLLAETGETYYTGELLPPSYRHYDVNWGLFRKAKLANGDVVWDTHYATTKIHDYGAVLSSSRMLKNPETNEPLGYLVIDVKERALANVYDKTRSFAGGAVYLLDGAGYVISSAPTKHRVGTRLETDYMQTVLAGGRGSFQVAANSQKAPAAMVIFDTSEKTGFKLLNVVPVAALAQESNSIRNVMLAMMAGFVVFSFWLALFLSSNMTRPLNQLREMMREAEQGNLDVVATVRGDDEIGQLAKSFNHMLSRIRRLIGQVYDKQDQLRTAELKAIQAQFNPHFLYNALDSINWMARMRGVTEISETAVALGGLLRFSIRTDAEMITVREEIEQINNYLTVQRMRYRDKFQTIIQMEDGLDDYYTLKLLLQPLVENAITHGLEHKSTPGTLRLIGRRVGERVCFTVEDDGVGLTHGDPTKVATMITGEKTGIGLENVRRRLQLHFGDNHVFKMANRPAGGTVVRIELPVITREEAAGVFNTAR